MCGVGARYRGDEGGFCAVEGEDWGGGGEGGGGFGGFFCGFFFLWFLFFVWEGEVGGGSGG